MIISVLKESYVWKLTLYRRRDAVCHTRPDRTFVFQEKLQNSFRQATTKISATIGLGLPRVDDGTELPTQPPPRTLVDDDNDVQSVDAVTDNDDDCES
jgi:hypothetical protein